MKKRLFVAIELPPKIKKKIIKIQQRLLDLDTGVTIVKPGNMHLTVLFLGNTDYNQIPEIIDALSKINDDSFEIQFTSLGGFPTLEKAHTLWLAVKENLGLFYLRQKILQKLQNLNLHFDDRKFIPHLTIARLKKRRKFISEQYPAKEIGKFRAREFVLFESELDSDGPIHTQIKKFCLVEK